MTNAPEPHAKLASERSRTRANQARAADPTTSVWVSANAGTGKTHVLTNRVLRLLVSGTPPERILCLTYTKAAAAEMSQRVFDRLAQWVTADDETLLAQLADLQVRLPTADEMTRARDLFAVAIETPGGLKVQTIHAFCERLLQRFPLEAGIPPQFAILDEETARSLQREAIDDVLIAATRDKDSELGKALQCAIVYAADEGFDNILREALGKREWLEAARRLSLGESDAFEAAEALYRSNLDLSPDADLTAIDAELSHLLSPDQLTYIRDVLQRGTKQDIGTAAKVAEALSAAGTASRIAALSAVFMTGTGEPRKSLMTKGLAASHPDVDALLQRKQDRFCALSRQRGHLAVVLATMALLRMACAVQQTYATLKQRRAALDFDDLVRATRNLLATAESAEWVLYKLDGGLDHILVDEAQDTSPVQWDVIRSLAREFFSGSSTREEGVRTLFAVGDEKQSIYGFQGAAPKMFADMGTEFQTLAEQSRQPWNRIPLTLSFRSVAAILDAVDRVFAQGGGLDGVTASGDIVRHAANRLGAAGHVEIWETETPDDADPSAVWRPLSEAALSSPVARLADRIADTIARWLDDGEILLSENRPVRAGDILILVRRRRPFAEAMVAALKVRGIPVAGADRIRLVDQLAVQDLMALADFLLLPEDDLSLAVVLKSPLFDLDDDDLIEIAPRRRGSLWSSLLGASENIARLRPAADTLKRWRARADLSPPFEFFVELLDRDGMRGRLLSRLGPEAADPIDEFLSLALSYDDGAPPSLQGFVGWLRRSEREIKRDMEHGRDEVRVMTVHGAKGLEAPIVFLPDTCTAASGQRPGGLLVLEQAVRPLQTPAPFLWPVKGSRHLDVVRLARADARTREAEERNRLLYVALTRPRDRLYVAGFEGVKGREQGCWYDLIVNGLEGALTMVSDAGGRPVRRLHCDQKAEPDRRREHAEASIAAELLPPFALRPAPREPELVIPLAPSRLAPLEIDAEGDPVEPMRDAAASPPPLPVPAPGSDGHRFLRGTITHALLQYLPGLDPAVWESAAVRFVEEKGRDLRTRTRGSIVTETLDVLRHPEFAPLFGPGSRAEVPIVALLTPPHGKGQVLRVTGQLDRLVQLDREVLIVDYKTNRPPPRKAQDVAETYLLQLAAYRLAVRQVFGVLPVRAALLWTDGPSIMPIPPEMLDAAETRLFTLDRASLDA